MNKYIEQWLNQHQREATNLLACAASIEAVSDLLESKPLGFCEYISIYSSYGVTMNVTVNVDSLREVAPLARQLAKIGVRINPEFKPESSKAGKTYYFKLPSTQLDYKDELKMEQLHLSVRVRGNSDGANCKYVQVGERTVPIMEWKCDDGTGSTNEAEVPEEAPAV